MGLVSYADIDTDLVERADGAVKARFTPLPVYKIGDVLAPSGGPLPFVEDAYRTTPAAEVRWFVAMAKPGMDRRAKLNLTEKGFKAFAPDEPYWWENPYSKEKQLRVRPLFPRYIFAGLPVLDRHGNVDSFAVRRCDGVADVVRCAGAPVSIDADAIGDLMWASEKRWLGFMQDKANERPTRQMRAEGFVEAMREIMSADPVTRLELFVERFRRKPKAAEKASCI